MRQFRKLSILISIGLIMGINSCSYYNTFYNAEQYYAEAQKLTRDNQQEDISREEMRLYSKSIEKSRKLLSKYPESKYRDDAQFLIAKSYYFKEEFTTAKSNFEKLALEYSNSPHTEEVPLWLGRCLVQLGDLEMGRHEASRILRRGASRELKADALLMMGEIAVKQDSFMLAEKYLEEAIVTSPDGYTKASARFQLGQIRESQKHYEGALEAYRGVSRYDPSESMKIEAIIRQTNMLKVLGRNEEAIELIQDMLGSDRFVDVRGQLEIELGKLYRSLGEYDLAISRLSAVVENYNRKEEAATANFFLGELYLLDLREYAAAREAYSDIRKQFTRSEYGEMGAKRLKQLDRYEEIQLEYHNLSRQLAGYKPVQVDRMQNSAARSRASAARRSRRGAAVEDEIGGPPQEVVKKEPPKPVKEEVPEPVTAEDSTRFLQSMAENRYALAEYMLFEFARVDTVLEICKDLEITSPDSLIRQRAAYMRYYAQGVVRGDSVAGNAVLSQIEENYPDYYKTILGGDEQEGSEKSVLDKAMLHEIAVLFERGDYAAASSQYRGLWLDTEASPATRSKACFNYAWMNDNFLYDKDEALSAYETLIKDFPDDPLRIVAEDRIAVLTAEPVKAQDESREDRREVEHDDPDKEDK
ncbi:MAG: tetratricopeptide repeat protein [Candidatus Marinimicrobia bacterium]|nr:tetratricopeptide repeat protein [Candidatus Neomarinimicrobiota bacterium]MCF7850085.1 tetratricopeptide repeat protein [Candidatus Neomarinimicrobiota bacterium]MCF7904854.1 tetratricopeptide repeat protein [Candidatus Neomarinimicrobiota bacterium]